MANGFHETGRFPCDKNIFRPRNFLLGSANTDAASVNRNVSATSSDQPSFSSVPLKPFTSVSIVEHQILCQASSYESKDYGVTARRMMGISSCYKNRVV